MKKTIGLVLAFCAGVAAADACTGLLAGKNATTDGSVIITYAADSHTLYGELYNQPAADHPAGAKRKIVEWDTGKYLGEIDEVPHTFSTIGNMNEKGLCITESTWGGREELVDSTGIVDYGSLIYIALQRASTAREAIKVMTDLVARYGYASEGESFSIADGDEAWVMEMIGKGGKSKGAVWVAIRIPDDCISGHANQTRIHRIPFGDKKNCMYSPDVVSFARSQGYFSGKDEDFSFSLAYGTYDYMALRGCDARVWAFFRKFNSGMEKYYPWVSEGEGEPLPLYVKAERKVSVRDMQWMMRDHFEDTPFDMNHDVGAGPFNVPYRWRPMSFFVDGVEYTHERAIATQQTGFSLVAQLRSNVPEAMKGVLWFGVDDANTCVYIPVYCRQRCAPHEFEVGNGDLYNISWDAAFWVNNYVANQAYNRYSQMIPDIRRVQSEIEDGIAGEIHAVELQAVAMPTEKATDYLTEFTNRWSALAVKKYKELGDYLLVKYLDGNIKKEKDGKFERTAEGMPAKPEFGGYDNAEYFRNIVEHTGDHFLVRKIPQEKK